MAKKIVAGLVIKGSDESKSAFAALHNNLSKSEEKFKRFNGRLAHLKSVGKGIGVAGGIVAGVGAAIGAAAVKIGASIKGAIDETAAYADELAKFGRQTGFAIEPLQELEYVAKRNGLALSDLRGGIVKMGKNLADLATGTGQAKTALEKLDRPLLKQIRGAKSNAEAFDLWIKRMGEIDDPAKRSAVTIALFGKSGQKMLRLLDGGPEALAALRAEMRKLGVVSEEDAAKAEAYADSQEKFETAVSSVKRSLSFGLMPSLTDAATKLSEFIAAHRPEIVKAFEVVTKNLSTAITNIVDAVTKDPQAFSKWLNNALEPINNIAKAIREVSTFVDDVGSLFGGKNRADIALERTGAGKVYGLPTETGDVSGIGGAVGAGYSAAKETLRQAGANKFLGPGALYYPVKALVDGVTAAIKSQKIEMQVIAPRGVEIKAQSTPGVEVSQDEGLDYFGQGF